jgi:hypothetical protein
MELRRVAAIIAVVCFVVLVAIGSESALAFDQKAVLRSNHKTRRECTGCHSSLKSVLPARHPVVAGNTLEACFKCHNPESLGKAEPRPFAAIMHVKHMQPSVGLACVDCHVWVPKSTFGFPGRSFALGKPSVVDIELATKVFNSWATSSNLDALHAKRQITCAGCHGKGLPQKGDTVENERCISCHGSYESLAVKTRPARFTDRNPHQSHLGEIGCAVCHHAHKPSVFIA